MNRSATIVLDTTPATGNRAILPLMLAGLALLALNVLAAVWEPIAFPLGLVTLGTMALALFCPSRWQGEDDMDTLNSLVLASLITLVGFQVMG
ncbi:hypothetical protein [Halomonas sp. CKK8]|uniref:hypothetical protein n=1 Tax=Halomonas sp. CKK8 TaxID=3036127 RepID=UPI00241571EE|nr:hypothetical protein [Halomonas sp. CKK8]WFM71173.1 hypothetical protein P8934_17575 [Halomonas sp. CKK8]